MLHYVLEARGEPFDWRDLEALPFHIFALLTALGIFQLVSALSPAMQIMAMQAIAILGLTGLRHLFLRDRGEGTAARKAVTA